MIKVKKITPLVLLFLLALLVRFLSTYPANTIIGFDQARDLFDAKKIIEGDLRIIGPTAGNNADLHHGVAFLYYLIPPILLGGGNPFWAVFYNSIFNASLAIILYFFSKSLFKSEKTALVTSFLSAVSYYLVQYSGWLSNPTATLVTVPLFFYGLWLYKEKNIKGLFLSSFFLGLSIQFEIFFLYLIPVVFIYFLLLRISLPKAKHILTSVVFFAISTSTMIATEIKFSFSGISSLILSTQEKGAGLMPFFAEFTKRFWNTFSQTLLPQNTNWGVYLGTGVLLPVIYQVFSNLRFKRQRENSSALLFCLIYLLSPLIMLLVGYHRAPWFLISLPPTIILVGGYSISKIKNNFLTALVVLLIAFFNLRAIKQNLHSGQSLLEPDKSSILSTQLDLIDYTYQKAGGKKFAINSVTNPLYVNAVWAYNYQWSSKKYGYLPSWLGGDQIHPFDTLPKAEGDEEMFFLIIDQTPRIPETYKNEALKWAAEKGEFIEEKNFEGIQATAWKTKLSASDKTF